MADPDDLSERCTPQRPGDLHEHTLISSGTFASQPEWRFTKGSKVIIERIRTRLKTTTNDSAIAASTAGLGIASLLSYQVADHLRDGRLRVVLQDYEDDPTPIHVVHYEGRRATQEVRRFIDMAVAALRADPAIR